MKKDAENTLLQVGGTEIAGNLQVPKQKVVPQASSSLSLGQRIAQQQARSRHIVPDVISLVRGRTTLSIKWRGGAGPTCEKCGRRQGTSMFLAEFLRAFAPSTDVLGPDGRTPYGKRGLTIKDIVLMGNYAVCLVFSDGHHGGIFHFDYLHTLANRKFELMRAYINELQKMKKSREPPEVLRLSKRKLLGEPLLAIPCK